MQPNEEIMNELRQMAPSLGGLPRNIPYRLPEDYFETLPLTILLRIRAEAATPGAEEIGMLSPLLASIKNKNPFTVPDQYFDTLRPVTAPATAPAPVRKMFPVFRYAAAAAVLILIAFAAWVFLVPTSGSRNEAVLAESTDSALFQQLSANAGSITDEEMINFLDASIYTVNAETVVNFEDDELEFRWMLADISDGALENYLN